MSTDLLPDKGGTKVDIAVPTQRRTPPKWALENGDAPVGYIPADGSQPHRFFLGEPPNRAFVLLGNDFRTTISVDQLITIAAGAWTALVGTECTRASAEAIARSWLGCLKKFDQPGSLLSLH